ncbi:hypothetical protein U729_2600 [Clostridium baratii str. Sullivan]|uniref:Uncharacterized protein n=1 Tax=Clostridium baratii str. Sullivan TaxID=1415775 RepID=A0A0A7FS27_9CLOT|nr:hypothetical protein [Clostridium baratii]AIY82407.1 hypothetical protein U729_2600 [Clostridium baratii str. Sullivan]
MDKIKEKGSLKNLTVLILIGIILLSVIYLIIAFINLLPIGIQFLKGEYSVTTDIMPNYSTVFESIFTLVSILTSLLVSFLLYKLTKQQVKTEYNKEIVGPANLVYFKIKHHLIHCLVEILNNNSDRINTEEVTQTRTQNEIEFIIYSNFHQINTHNLEDNIYKILGEIEDEESVRKLLLINEEILRSNSTIRMLRPGLIVNNVVRETSGEFWANIIVSLYNNNFEYLNDNYKKMMNNILELSKRRK